MEQCLAGLKTAISGLQGEDYAAAVRSVQTLGGEVVRVSATCLPDVLVCTSVRSQTYQALRASKAGTRVLRPAWLEACIASGSRVPFRDFTLGTFAGLVVSTSGNNIEEKRQAQQLVENLGGRYSAEFTRQCTHLVLKGGRTRASEKEKAAYVWGGVKVVWDSWLAACCAGGCCADEAQHAVEPLPREPLTPLVPQARAVMPNGASHSHGMPQVSADAKPRQSLASAPRTSMAAAYSMARDPPAELALVEASGRGSVRAAHGMEGGLAASERGSQASLTIDSGIRATRVCSGSPSVPADDALSSGRSPEPPPGKMGVLVGQRGSAGLAPEEEVMFLDGLQVHLAGCNRDEMLGLIRICREGGATRDCELSASITHIVVGADASREELDGVRSHLQTHAGGVKAAKADWLHHCGALRGLVPLETRWELSADTLLMAAREMRADMSGECSAGALQNRSTATAAEDGAPGEQGAGSGGALAGCWFTLAALADNPNESARVQRQIKQNGGFVFDEQRTPLVKGADARAAAFAICPFGFPPAQQIVAKRRADFRLVPQENWRTPFWVDLCQEAGTALHKLRRDQVTCCPLPVPVPLAGMETVRVTASGMDEAAKGTVKEIVKHLGGKYTLHMTRQNTHLVLERATGAKFHAASAYGVIPITPEWLVASADAGKLLPEEHFYPPPPPGAGAEGLEERAAPLAASTQGLLPTQLSPASRACAVPHDLQDMPAPPRLRATAAAGEQTFLRRMMQTPLVQPSRAMGGTFLAPSEEQADHKGNVAVVGARARPANRSLLVSGSQLHALAAQCVTSGAPAAAVEAALAGLQASEAQDGEEKEGPSAWEAAVAQMGSLIRNHAPAAQACSQLDTFTLPQPRGASRMGAAPSDGASGGSCSMSGVSQHQRRGTRSSVADAGDSGDTSQGSAGGRKRVRAALCGDEVFGVVGRALRKAGQAAERGFDCSQQVGYEGGQATAVAHGLRRRVGVPVHTAAEAAAAPQAGGTMGGSTAASVAKAQLARAVEGTCTRSASRQDELAEMGLM